LAACQDVSMHAIGKKASAERGKAEKALSTAVYCSE